MKIKRKQIAFNLDDPFQRELYEYVCKITTNFSSYGKFLIKRDMTGSWSEAKNSQNEFIQLNHFKENEEGSTKANFDTDIAKGFI